MRGRSNKRNRSLPRWPRLPWLPLLCLLCIALPLAIWQSPGSDPRATTVLVVALALYVLAAATARAAPLAWARAYFAIGAGMALLHQRFHANELAGVMLLFLPLAAALALSPGTGGSPYPLLSPVRRLQTGLLALLFGGTLLATGSRGGLLALLGAAAVVVALERRWRLMLLGLTLAGVLAAVGGIDWLLHDGKAQGLTLDSLFTGRPEIWRRSLHAVADFPWTGIGVGSFPEIVPVLYGPAGAGRLEDAHNLVLQTALDLGIPGLLALAAIVALALRRSWSAWRRAPAASQRRAWAVGLFASLLAFVLFNLFDAVALGSAGSLPFFILLGFIQALPRPRPERPRRRRRLLLVAIVIVLGPTFAGDSVRLNRAAVLGARAVAHDPGLLSMAHAVLVDAGHVSCRAGWLEGKVAQAWGHPGLRDDAWADLLRCSAAFVPMIAAELPGHRRLAEQAVGQQPSSAAAHFWLARVRVGSGDRAAAERLYRRGLELDPSSGVAWLELGRLLAPGDPEAALEAFKKSCRHGDPGANACFEAGAAAEQLGDVEAAIRFYLESRWDRARERARQLQRGD